MTKFNTYTLLQRAALLIVAIVYVNLSITAQRQHPENLMFTFADSINQLTHPYHNTPLLNESNVKIYLRHNMFTHRNGFILRYIPNMPQLERGTNEYVTEAQLMLQLRPPGEMDCKVIAFHSTDRYLRPERFTAYGRFNFQIYESKLFIDQLLNPFNQRNSRFYRYNYAFANIGNDSTPTTIRIRIRPRFSNEQLAEGYADINAYTGAVVRFVLHFNYQLQRITINARMGHEGYDLLVPQRMRITSDFKLLGNRVFETTDVFAQHTFSCPLPRTPKRRERFDLTNQCWLRIDTTHVITSVAYFDSIRPMALREVEKWQLKRDSALTSLDLLNDTTFSLPNDLQQANTTNKSHSFFNENTQNILLSSHALNLTSNGYAKLKLPAIITPSMLQWSGNKGFSLRTRLKISLNKQPTALEDFINFSPSIGYSFKQRQIYWQLPLNIRFWPSQSALLTFEAGGGTHSYNNKQAEELRLRFKGKENFDSLNQIINHYGFNDYLDTYALCYFSVSPSPGFKLTIGARYHHRILIDWNEAAQAAGLAHRLSSIGPRIQLEWTPAQYYYRNHKRRIPLFSHYPTFIANYERGIGLNNNATYYERIEGDVRYKLPLYALRSLYFRAGAGCYTQRGNNCFIDYDFFRFDYVPQGWNDELTGEIQLLSSRWYNESRYYLRCTTTYESPMLALSRLPYISRIIKTERVYLNLLSVRALGIYAEAGYGFSTHLMDVGVFTGMANNHVFNFGCKVVLKSL